MCNKFGLFLIYKVKKCKTQNNKKMKKLKSEIVSIATKMIYSFLKVHKSYIFIKKKRNI